MHFSVHVTRCCLTALVISQFFNFVNAEEPTKSVDFNRDIKPIISNACYRCHGPDPAERKGGLRLDTAAGAVMDLGGHAAIVPGQPDASELIKRITTDDGDLAMPPNGAGKRLSPREVELLKAWIQQGAHFSQHWSYVKPVRPKLPAVTDTTWGKNEVDRFILARLEKEGLKPSPEADRYSLIRRVSLDLTGLPPSIAEVDAFVQDPNPNAYEALVDRLLAKSSYGEHWGLLWLDLARYADSAGYADDPPRTIWLYRDYVIKSFNANKPFDQFTIEQIAGDLLPNPNDDQLTGTAFHRNTLTNNEGGTNDEEFRNVAVVDRVNTTMAVWMGTTMACAQCHTHKYDPITQDEYFQFFAFFNNTDDADRRDESPLHSIYSEEQLQRRSQLQAEIAKVEPVTKTVTPEIAASEAKWDQEFPRAISWAKQRPSSVQTQTQVATSIEADDSVKVAAGASTNTYTVEIPETAAYRLFCWLDPARLEPTGLKSSDVVKIFRDQQFPVIAERGDIVNNDIPDFQLSIDNADVKRIDQINDVVVKTKEDGSKVAFRDVGRILLAKVPLRAIRIETLPDDSLPGHGPGHAEGNFLISKVSARVHPPTGSSLLGRYVRIELPGGEKYLSLAEVQVFSGNDNIASRGEASQSSTDFAGDAKRAIDGNTNGNYSESNSVTHTAASTDPWWELDFKTEQMIDRLAIWNRTDSAGERLSNFRVLVLNDQHDVVWRYEVAAAPNPSTEFRIDSPRAFEFEKAIADYSQQNYDASNVLATTTGKNKGWAVGGSTGNSHSLILLAKKASELPTGCSLTLTIEQQSQLANHTVGRFRVSVTDEPRVEEWTQTPEKVIATLQVPAASRTPKQKSEVTQYYLTIAPQLESARQQLATLQKSFSDIKPDTVPVMKELKENRRVTKLQHRGNFEDLGNEVHEGTPAVFPPLPPDAPKDRLTLAKWLVDKENPLTGRVIANRYWELLFGIGIVSSSEEFGSQGDLPFHPELLDWLAAELAGLPADPADTPSSVRQPWDLKAFVKLLVMSATYRQSSKVSPELEAKDPDNRLLARGPRFRISAETLRDQALFVGGLLSSKMYGQPVKPPQPNLGLNAAFGSSTDWQTSAGEDKYRRGVYTTWRRSNPYPSMATFDAPNREVCTVRRVRTNTPLQALVTMNDPVYVEAAQALARRIVKEGGASTAERATYGFRLALSRPPTPNELNRLMQLYEKSFERFSKDEDAAKRMATEPLGPAEESANLKELAAWTVVGNVLMSLDEVIMKR